MNIALTLYQNNFAVENDNHKFFWKYRINSELLWKFAFELKMENDFNLPNISYDIKLLLPENKALY